MHARINGEVTVLDTFDPQQSLLSILRDELGLTGAKRGCGEGFCGACTVLIDGKAMKACRETVESIDGKEIVTIEALAGTQETLHPLQQAFIDAGAVQCGYCTPGMILTAHAFLQRNHSPTRSEIRRAISPNLCRCTGYQQIIDAIEQAAKFYQA